jgi:hypothetical protein
VSRSIYSHYLARSTIHDLLGLSAGRPTEELQELARRCGVTP